MTYHRRGRRKVVLLAAVATQIGDALELQGTTGDFLNVPGLNSAGGGTGMPASGGVLGMGAVPASIGGGPYHAGNGMIQHAQGGASVHDYYPYGGPNGISDKLGAPYRVPYAGSVVNADGFHPDGQIDHMMNYLPRSAPTVAEQHYQPIAQHLHHPVRDYRL